VINSIGAGGMGYVYRVRHAILNKEFALKTLSLSLDENVWARFQNEARAIAKINHPNIVTIYNLGIHQGQKPYYVMDLLSGKTLSGLLAERGYLDWEEALPIFIEVCSGLGFAHKSGIIHRDIKPENLLILDQPQHNCHVKIFDFGIAKLAGALGPNNQKLTRSGEICGSPLYMSPEQANGDQLNARSDLYSLGCSLFEVLTGRPPFAGETAMGSLLMHQMATPPTLQEACGRKFPDMLEAAVAALLAKAPNDRYQTCELLSQDLRKISEGQSAPIKPFFSTPLLSHEDSREDSHFVSEGKLANRVPLSNLMAIVGLAITALLCVSIGLAAFWPRHNASASSATTKAEHKVNAFALENATPNDFADVGATMGLDGPRDSDKAPESLKELTPFCTRTSINGVATKHFEFPRDASLGTIADKSLQFHPATGPVDLHDDQDSMLKPGPDLAKYPQYASRFQPGDVNYVLIEGHDADGRYLAAARQIPGFKRLLIQNCPQIDADDLKLLNPNQNLTEFGFSDCAFSADDVAKLPWIRHVVTIACVDENSPTKLLTVLAEPRKNNLHLILFNSKITRQDFLLLSRQPRLTDLALYGSDYSRSDLTLLSSVRDLRTLELGDCQFDTKLIEILRPLKQVKKLITTNVHSPSSIATMQMALPMLTLEQANPPHVQPRRER
jgi:serine/threonine protein kinase